MPNATITRFLSDFIAHVIPDRTAAFAMQPRHITSRLPPRPDVFPHRRQRACYGNAHQCISVLWTNHNSISICTRIYPKVLYAYLLISFHTPYLEHNPVWTFHSILKYVHALRVQPSRDCRARKLNYVAEGMMPDMDLYQILAIKYISTVFIRYQLWYCS